MVATIGLGSSLLRLGFSGGTRSQATARSVPPLAQLVASPHVGFYAGAHPRVRSLAPRSCWQIVPRAPCSWQLDAPFYTSLQSHSGFPCPHCAGSLSRALRRRRRRRRRCRRRHLCQAPLFSGTALFSAIAPPPPLSPPLLSGVSVDVCCHTRPRIIPGATAAAAVSIVLAVAAAAATPAAPAQVRRLATRAHGRREASAWRRMSVKESRVFLIETGRNRLLGRHGLPARDHHVSLSHTGGSGPRHG